MRLSPDKCYHLVLYIITLKNDMRLSNELKACQNGDSESEFMTAKALNGTLEEYLEQ